MRQRTFILASLIVLSCVATSAQAQWRPGSNAMPGGISYQTTPTISPYLQLTRPGGSAALNYAGLVRPTFDFQNAINGLQQQVNDAQSSGMTTDNPLLTGGTTRFLSTGNYFMNIRGGQGGGYGGNGGRGGNNIMIVSPQRNQAMTANFQGGAPAMTPQR